ncbi:MAG: hypothetical protein DWQ05_06055 [Calditrichaeota bacterium]|nr:MAG: hypothetical protein DWQ05_06055 [Calditrichota bacterium]
MKKYQIHVISNTHWDREWLYNFQETRLMLVEMMDGLLDILEKEPEYKSYVLDSQTVLLEDYLELRPENKERLKKQVESGRLLIGPWYSAPESFSVNGESLARNLLMGHRIAREFGAVMKVGYTPFGYGQNSQMPQLYQGFDIESMLFYHGVSHDEVKNEFIFAGADGTQILGSQMSSGARYCFYHNVYRPVVCGKSIKEREFQWKEGGMPFRLADVARNRDHHRLIQPEFQFDEDKLKRCVRNLMEDEKNVATTRFLTFMSGHDSSIADSVELKLINSAKKHLPDAEIFHSSLPELMDKIKSEARNLTILTGERRTPKLMNGRVHLYSDVLSSRTRMKMQNARAEYNLQRVAEPLAVIANMLGYEFPASAIEYAWKSLLKCHAHDSIAGSGVDDIERDMMNRLQQVNNLCDSLTRRSLEKIQLSIDMSGVAKDAVILTIYNPSPFQRSEVISAVLDIPADPSMTAFSLKKIQNDEPVAVQICARKPHKAVINQPSDATLMMDTEQVLFHFLADEIPSMGYSTFYLNSTEHPKRGGLVCGQNAMENEFLHVQINPNGTLRIKNKETGHIFDNLHYFEDSGDAGHAWMFIEPAMNQIINTLGQPVIISLEENGPLLARFQVIYSLQIPVSIDYNESDKWQSLDGAGGHAKRSNHTCEMKIISQFTLRKGSRVVEVKTSFENNAENHRLRVMFPTGLESAKTCHVETAFDVVEREVVMPPDSPWFGGENATFPMQRFVDVHDEENGLAIINNGLLEYQVTDDSERTIALTLLRAYEVNLTTVSWRWESHPEMKGSQCLGFHEFAYNIYPHAKSWSEVKVVQQAEKLSVPLLPVQSGTGTAGTLSPNFSFLKIAPAELILSALKQAEDGEGIVIRIFNPTEKDCAGKIRLFKEPIAAEIVNLEETFQAVLPVKNNIISVPCAAKKIVTVKFKIS